MRSEAQIDHVTTEDREAADHRLGWLPHPIFTVVIAVMWVILAKDLTLRNVLLGLVFGWLITLFTSRFLPVKPRVGSWLALARFAPVFGWDIVVANLTVARIILDPTREPRSAWVVIPLTTRNPYTISTLANVITLTPGTVSAELDPGRRTLLVHALDTEDPDAEAELIKRRYERPLMEIFG
jgi:multicomponent K+:H+ antiporter subunit E